MELRHLRYFVAVAEAENVSRAALKLHLSQPALSRQIRDLEDELGFLLFERTAKSLHLTEAGRAFLIGARAVLQQAEESVQKARAIATGGRGELHVGYAPTLTVRILPPALRQFQQAKPKVRVKLHDLSTEEMLAGLREGELHLAFTVRPGRALLRGLRFEALRSEPLRLAVAPTHPFARLRVVPLSQVVHEPLIAYSRTDYPEYHDLLREVFAATDDEPRIAEEHDGVSSLLAAVDAGIGVAIVPESMNCLSGPRLRLLALSPDPKPLVTGAVLPQGTLAPATDLLLQCARQAVAGA